MRGSRSGLQVSKQRQILRSSGLLRDRDMRLTATAVTMIGESARPVFRCDGIRTELEQAAATRCMGAGRGAG